MRAAISIPSCFHQKTGLQVQTASYLLVNHLSSAVVAVVALHLHTVAPERPLQQSLMGD